MPSGPRTQYRGSRKHILDWVERPDFLPQLRRLVAAVPCEIPDDAHFMPRGFDDPREARLPSFGDQILPKHPAWADLRRWWLPKGSRGNTPNWDLVVQCSIEEKPGLILVEAKANQAELSRLGKARFRPSPKGTPHSAQISADNRLHIASALETARTKLVTALPDLRVGVDSHYQLSNRLAFAWRLASCGIPSVLIYLGFLEDIGVRGHLRSDSHWSNLFAEHVSDVCARGIGEEPIDVEEVKFWVLCRHLTALQPSPLPLPPQQRGLTDPPSREGALDNTMREEPFQ